MTITTNVKTSIPVSPTTETKPSTRKSSVQEQVLIDSQQPEIIVDSDFPSTQDKDRELIQQYFEAFRLTDRDQVQIYVIPKGYSGLKPGSYIHKPTASTKTQQLSKIIKNTMRQIQELESGISNIDISEDERASQIALLRNNLQQYKKSLSNEQTRLSNLPRSGYIIIERDE